MEQHPEIQFVGLNVADQDARARDFVDEKGWDWPQMVDHSRTKAKRLGATYQPAFFAIDENGILRGTFVGYGDPNRSDAWEQLEQTLQ